MFAFRVFLRNHRVRSRLGHSKWISDLPIDHPASRREDEGECKSHRPTIHLPPGYYGSRVCGARFLQQTPFEFLSRLLIHLVSKYTVGKVLPQLCELLPENRQCLFLLSRCDSNFTLQQRPQQEDKNKQGDRRRD